MEKDVKKAIKRLLWLDFLFGSTNSLWGTLDEIEDELEDIFDRDRNREENFMKIFNIKKDEK